jgi:hypothetical protein
MYIDTTVKLLATMMASYYLKAIHACKQFSPTGKAAILCSWAAQIHSQPGTSYPDWDFSFISYIIPAEYMCGSMSMSICEKTTSLIFLTFSWYTTLLTTPVLVLVQLLLMLQLLYIVLILILALLGASIMSESPIPLQWIKWCQSRSHITTDGQLASSSWCLTSFGASDQMLHLFEWQLFSLFFM